MHTSKMGWRFANHRMPIPEIANGERRTLMQSNPNISIDDRLECSPFIVSGYASMLALLSA